MTKAIPHQLFQISKNLRHGYSTVSNMRRYGHQCQTLFGLFNSFFLSPPIRCISLCLHLSLSLSGILATPSRPSDLAIADLATPRDRDRPGSPLIIDPLCDKEELQCKGTVAGSENFHQRQRRRRFGMWVCLIWWMWVCAGGGIVLWVCLIWWMSGVGCSVLDVGLFGLVDGLY